MVARLSVLALEFVLSCHPHPPPQQQPKKKKQKKKREEEEEESLKSSPC